MAVGSGPPLLWKAISEGRSAASITTILDGGASVEYEYRGVRLLQLAIEANNSDVVRLLLERGATAEGADFRVWTALHSAAFSGNIELILLVLKETDNQAPKDHQGWTPLDLAAFHKHDDITKILDPEGKVKKFAWQTVGPVRIKSPGFFHPPAADSVIEGIVEAGGREKQSMIG